MSTPIRTFVKSLEEREFSKTPRQKFWDFCELAYCALSKQATYDEEAEALKERYMEDETERPFSGFQKSGIPEISTNSLY